MWCLLIILFAEGVNEPGSSPTFPDTIFTHNRKLPSQPSTRSSELGPFRLKFINRDKLPIDDVLEGISLYFYNTVSVYSLLVPIKVDNCQGDSILENDVDFVIIVKRVNNVVNNGFTCANEDTAMQNPIAGWIQIYITIYDDIDSLYLGLLRNTFKALGINYDQLPLWKKNSLGEVYDQNPIRSNDKGTFLMTPKVIEKLNLEYATSNLIGMRLTHDSSISKGIWWDLRYARGDVMSALFKWDNFVSPSTLAALEDSGWYSADYSMATSPIYGYQKGDKYFESTCTEVLTTDIEQWCIYPFRTCTFSRLKKGVCENQSYYNLYNDKCAFPMETASCRYGSFNGIEASGLNSRCFMGTLSAPQQSLEYYTKPYCFEVIECSDSEAVVKIQSTTVSCPFTGGDITVPGYSGILNCPDSNILCRDVPCKQFCSLRGKCNYGVCECFDGWFGDICNMRCSSGCAKCLGNGICTLCVNGYFIQNGQCVKCLDPCLTCSSDTVCLTCNDGYYLSEGSCLNCNPECKLCSSISICSDCNIGYYLTEYYCCATNCQNCTHESCSICKDGFYLSLGSCIDCPLSCSSCSGNDCVDCAQRFYLNGRSCDACPSNCLECLSSSICILCEDNSILDNQGVCNPCPFICSGCSNNECTGCVQGFYLNGPICCPDNCETCDLDVCFACKPGFLYSSGRCYSCPDTCTSCLNGVCVGCNDGFYLSGSICDPCMDHCKTCSSNSFCEICLDSFFLQDNGQCVTCPSVCNSCHSSVCFDCIVGYSIYQNICCPSGCDTCDLNVCFACKPGFLYSSGRCYSCPDSCTSCLNGVCVGCNDGFYLSGSICDPCMDHCKTCSSNSFCEVCLDSFFLQENGQCVTCPSVCNSCHSSVCFDCIVGYSINQNICCPSGCDTCDLNVCWTCKDNYYFSNGNCIDCPSACTSCKNGACVDCIKGYYISGTSCLKCTGECTACSSATSCSECSLYYYLSGSSCLACPSYCTKCQGTICYSCETGYKLAGKKCKLIDGSSDSDDSNPDNGRCGGHCELCEGHLCKKCYEGFYISSSKCLPCAGSCKKCLGVWDCKECKSEFQLAFGVCCPKSCSSCSTTACYSCKPDFFLSSGNCISCPSSCEKCLNGVCTSCKKGFYISGTSCPVCPANCASCSSLTWCNSCNSGYKLTSGKCL